MDLPPFPIIPHILVDPTDLFAHVIEHIIRLDTQVKRDRVIVCGSVTTVDGLLLVDMDRLLDCLTDATSVMAKTHSKTLKMWAEEQFDINQQVNIQEFTEVTCCEKQMKVVKAAIKTKTGVSDSGSNGKEKWKNCRLLLGKLSK
jgi:hypothetical protein